MHCKSERQALVPGNGEGMGQKWGLDAMLAGYLGTRHALLAPLGEAPRTIADVVIARSAQRDEAISLHAGDSK